MPDIPDCLHRRYKALDELIGDLSALPRHGSHQESFGNIHSQDPGIKLMCDFWNILKEDPDCNLCQAVKQRMGLGVHGSGSMFPRQKVACYMAGRDCNRGNDANKKDTINKINDICSASQSSNRSTGCPTSTSKEKPPDMLLTKALCNLKEAASLDKKCTVRVTELMETQKELKDKIQNLEQREKDGVALLKEADCMWSCMEDEYKKKIAESIDRQKELMKQLREVEKSNNKWRKNKKELEDQIKSVNKCRQEINDKTMHKKNDIKVIEMEITDFTKRIATNNRLSDGSKQVLNNKRTVSDKKMAGIAAEITKLKSTLAEVQKHKKSKDEDGQKYVKEARGDLQNICKLLLQKKIENEDLLAEKEAILQEIDLLKQACDQCKDKCQSKRNHIDEEIKKFDTEIADYRYQCVQCHQCIDTTDVRNFCSDCPKCKERRECITSGDHCDRDTKYDCVCIGIKEKFLSNVFENMYTVMERQSKTKPGKALANSIVKCLKNSRNGKLTDETKRQVQEFVLNTVKKNLNLTIVGGAVKTRCEMDADTYNQLMLCLKQVKAEQPPKEDKGTVAKKESCRRWGGTSECNCPGGAKYCACTRRAPPPPRDPSPCPPVLEKEEEPAAGTVVLCPHKESVGCGPDCAMRAVPSSPATDLQAGKPSDCATSACPFIKHMRAAQCVLGPESLNSLPRTYMTSTPFIPGTSDRVNSRYGGASTNPSTCKQDTKQLKAGYSNNSTYIDSDNSMKDIYHGFPKEQKNTLLNESLIKRKQQKQTTSSQSSQALTLPERVFDIENLLKAKKTHINTKSIEINKNEPEFRDKNIQSASIVTPVDLPNENFPIEVKQKLIDLFDAKSNRDTNRDVNYKRTDSEHSIHFNSYNRKDHIFEIRKDNDTKIKSSKVVEKSNNSVENAENKRVSTLNKSILKFDLQQKYEENKTTIIKLQTETGIYKTIHAPVTKTFSGNIAVDINQLCEEMEMNNKEHNVALTISNSGSTILNQNFDGFANAVVRKSASGSFLIVLADPVFQSRKIVNRIAPPIEKIYKIRIETDANDTAEPPAVLKVTPSHNYLVVPDKEYENQYKETILGLLEDSTEYYVSLTKPDSQNCVLQIDNSWEKKEPNALVVKTDSGEVKILTRRNALDSGRKRISVTSSSKVLGGIIDKLPKTTEAKRLSTSSKRSMTSKKSSSDSNIYEKVKLFRSDYKDLLAEPSTIFKMPNSGQYAVILDKESKNTLTKSLGSYFKNNFQGLVPIKKTHSGEITIALKSEQTDINKYGSLKITPSGNLYVIVDKELVKDFTGEDPLHTNRENNSFADVTSRHIIGKLQHPVNKSVTTSCNAMPENDCDKSKCACADIKYKKIDWVVNHYPTDKTINFFGSQVCGIDWKKVTSNPDGSYNISDEKSTENYSDTPTNGSDTKALPHIIIKPCTCQPLLNNPHANQHQCFYVIEAVCPFDDNMSNCPECHVRKDVQSNANWDSLTFLPPQLPDFLKDIKYQ